MKKVDYELQLINGGQRERRQVLAGIHNTFGPQPFGQDPRNILAGLHGKQLIDKAEEITLFILSQLEF